MRTHRLISRTDGTELRPSDAPRLLSVSQREALFRIERDPSTTEQMKMQARSAIEVKALFDASRIEFLAVETFRL